MTAHPFSVTLWPDLVTTTGVVQALSEFGLRKFVENADSVPPHFAHDLQAWKRSAAPMWSPTTFEGNARAKAGALRTCALVLDFDEPHPDPQAWLAAIGEVLSGDSWLAHTSVRAQPGACKWRLIVPLREPLSAERWELAHRRLWHLVETRTGFKVDPQAADVSRAWVCPTRAPSGFFLHFVAPGALVDGEKLAAVEAARRRDQEAQWRAIMAHSKARRFAPGDVSLDARKARALRYLEKKEPAISGSQGHMAAWSAVLSVVRGLDLDEASALEVLGPWNARCEPPWSERELRHKVSDALSKAKADPGFLLTKGVRDGR